MDGAYFCLPFSTNVPDDSNEVKKKQRKTPVRGKLDKVSHIQPRYKLDENINHGNEGGLMENQSRLMELLTNG